MIDFGRESKERYQLQQEFLGTGKLVNRTQPMVSVSVATYQHVGFIEQCLDGILAQKTDFPYEIIVGEDGSEDGTRDICIRYATKHQDKIRLFLRDRKTTVMTREGRQYRFNGIFCRMSARGKYVALCEGDDYWTDPHKLQKQVGFLEAHPEYSMCAHRVAVVNAAGVQCGELPQKRARKQLSTLHDMLVHCAFHTCSLMIRSGLVKEYPEWYLKAPVGDFPLIILHAQHGYVGYLDELMAVQRLHAGGVWTSRSTSERLRIAISTLDQVERHLGSEYRRSASLGRSRTYLEAALTAHDQSQSREAKAYLIKSISSAPSIFHAYTGDQLVMLATLYTPRLLGLARLLTRKD